MNGTMFDTCRIRLYNEQQEVTNGAESKAVEMDYDDFEKLCVEKLGFPRDFSLVAAMEWGNDESHTFEVGLDDLKEMLEFEREDMTEIRDAVAHYNLAVGLNGGVDPYITWPRQPENDMIQHARGVFFRATQWNLHLIALLLLEQGAIEPGNYLINVSW